MTQGFDESDWSGRGSDRLVDTFVAWGDADALSKRMRQYVDAGAGAIVLGPLPPETRDPASAWELLETLAPCASA